MSYDQEYTFWKSCFVPEDLNRMVDLMLDTSMKTKDFSQFNVT